MDSIKQSSVDTLKRQKNSLIAEFSKRNSMKASLQVLSTVIPYFVLFYAAIKSVEVSYWLSAFFTSLLILFILRVFVMMHDCGHNALFPSAKANSIVGFFLGVLCGVPQYVWSKHHDYHHATNGNWDKYRGPLSVKSVDEYELLTAKEKTSFAKQRKIYMAPLAGFLYFIFNPRFSWLKGSVQLGLFVAKEKFSKPSKPVIEIANEFETGYWSTWPEYRHMAANNLVLFALVSASLMYFDTSSFLVVYTFALSLAGALGILLFSVQHNFEDSYASVNEGWDYFRAAIEGTSFLQLPAWLNWFTADIAFHHVHHLSARIPNYELKNCHIKNQQLFTDVPRVRLRDVPSSLNYIIWDNHQNRLITVKMYEDLYAKNQFAQKEIPSKESDPKEHKHSKKKQNENNLIPPTAKVTA